MAEEIQVPAADRPMSDLDGVLLTAVVHDPDAQLYGVLESLRAPLGRAANAPSIQIVGVLPFQYHGVSFGYIVVSYDPLKDPRWQPLQSSLVEAPPEPEPPNQHIHPIEASQP